MGDYSSERGFLGTSIFQILSAQDNALRYTLLRPDVAIHDMFSLVEGGKANPDADAHKWFWLLGVTLAFVGATLTSVGLLLQKRSHLVYTPEAAPRRGSTFPGSASGPSEAVANARGNKEGSKWPYWMRGHWIVGLLFWLMGNVVCWLGMGMAPQSILSVMDCWNIVVALAIAPWCFGEPVSKQTFAASFLLVTGTLWIIATGPKDYTPETAEKLLISISDPGAHIALACTMMFQLCMAGVAYSHWEKTPALSAFQFVLVSATFAWYATILSKSSASLILTSVADAETKQLQTSLFWIFIATFLCSAASQMHFLNLGMKYGDAVIVIPSYMALSMLGQMVFGGLIFFHEFRNFTTMDQIRFWPGVAFVLIGVAALASQESLPNKSENNCDESAPLLTNARDGN